MDTFVQDASQLWTDPNLASETASLCKVCGFYVEPSHDIQACIEAWGKKLRALIEQANEAMRKNREAA